MKINVQRTAVFIVLLALVPLHGRGGLVEGRLPADFGTKAKQHIEALVKIGPRQAGTLNEGLAAGYIADQFKAMGVPAIIEPFAFESYEVSRIELKIGGENFTPAGLGMDPYAGGFTYSGTFILLDPRASFSGPASPDAAGKVVVTSEEGDPSLHFRIAALQPRFIIDLARTDFDRVRGLDDGELSLSIRGGLSKGISRNVIAHMGSNLPAPQIIIGSHMDTFRDSPGANDNASGVAALLELARHLKDLEIPDGIGLTFIAFGAEEVGILGSRLYVERHAEELRHYSLALVFDDLGGEGPVQVERTGGRSDQPQNPGVGIIPQAYLGRAWGGLRYPWSLLPPPSLFGVLGSCYHPAWLAASIDEAVKELEFQVQLTGMQGSDQMSFAQAGIATSGISAVNGRGHTQSDRLETVNIEKVRQCAETARRIIQKTWNHLKPSFQKKPIHPLSDHNPKDNLTRANLMAHVRLLASDELRGRRAGSPQGAIAARYIAERLRAAGQVHGLTTRPYPEKYRYLYAEDDSISFADKGIPSLTVSPGFTEGDEERIRKYIHTPADRVDSDFDEDYLLKFCQAYAGLARAIANAETVPTWIRVDSQGPGVIRTLVAAPSIHNSDQEYVMFARNLMVGWDH